MPTIEFNTYSPNAYENWRPTPASKMLPEWWKNSKIHSIQNGQPTISLRACPAMHDWLATGYYIVANRDIHCIFDPNSKSGGHWTSMTLPSEEDPQLQGSPTHASEQLMGDNFSFHRKDGVEKPFDAFKFRVPWYVTTPPGYSSLYLDPFLHQNKYVRTWQGLMDTDMFNTQADNGQIIMYPQVDHSFVIKKDTPVVQIVPYRREQWVASYGVKDINVFATESTEKTSVYKKQSIEAHCREEGDAAAPDNQIPGGFYRKYMWTNKNKEFKDAPTEECPFDPKTGEMKKDFKDKQRELTDLNWDGSESEKIDRE